MNSAQKHRKYCNHVKNILFTNSTKNIPKDNNLIRLMDLASGRGGDIFKWNKLHIGLVYGFDIDQNSTKEAIRRYSEAIKNRIINIKISFYTTNISSNHNFIQNKIKKPVDIISCMFALHYFSQNLSTLTSFIKMVSQSLNVGGIFTGIAPDSKYIKKILNNKDIYNNPNVIIRKSKDKQNSYQFMILDESGNDYFSFKGISSEFFINKEQFKTLAIKYHLQLQGNFKNIFDHYPPHHDKVNISQLYFSFTFKKVNIV